MATTVQVYYISNSSAPFHTHTGLMRKAHCFRSKNGWLFTSDEKSGFPEAPNLLLQYSCDDEDFLYAAACAQKASPAVRLAHQEIIEARGLEADFEEVCESRDAVIIDYLEFLKKEWSIFPEKYDRVHQHLLGEPNMGELREGLHDLRDCLRIITNHIETEIDQHPEHWRQALSATHSLAPADCLGRMEVISWSFQKDEGTIAPCDSLSILERLMFLEERYRKELAEIEAKLTSFRERQNPSISILTETPTLYQSLLHLSLILLGTDTAIVRTVREDPVRVVSWQRADWERKCEKADNLSDNDYEGLALTLRILLALLKALMARLRALAHEIVDPIPPKDDKFTVTANIMTLCSSIGIFAINPQDEEIHSKGDYAAILRESPLYKGKDITIDGTNDELNRILAYLELQCDPSKNMDASHDQLVVRKRPSDSNLSDEKRRRTGE
ncbi:hypothetical protein AJ79_10209 [Helicocarpus griseus UAMH5409]|uniref:Uncharacterized protein n=1 Tax=Helicocarpus griseus UAMH5409 TaxID=1447875 RepID=A0A2B7WF22_9EURO|nr:hypothetical protein AJ79_10209 [Helicocarpus griseus UAMH5409]